MAAVRQWSGRRAYDFAPQTCHLNRPRIHNKRGGSVTNTSSLSAALLLGDFQYGGLFGAGKAADPATVGGRSLCLGHGRIVFVRAYSDNGAASEPLHKTKTGYYDILEVTPTASQSQIKTAYYKQSFVYHPDRNAGSETATLRFSEINEAYTVLGNMALRKKYDRGLLSLSDLVATAKSPGKDTTGSSAKQRPHSRRSVMGADTRGDMFDFDQFFKTHYNEQLQREKNARAQKEKLLKKKQETIADKNPDWLLEVGAGMMVGLVIVILISLKQR